MRTWPVLSLVNNLKQIWQRVDIASQVKVKDEAPGGREDLIQAEGEVWWGMTTDVCW